MSYRILFYFGVVGSIISLIYTVIIIFKSNVIDIIKELAGWKIIKKNANKNIKKKVKKNIKTPKVITSESSANIEWRKSKEINIPNRNEKSVYKTELMPDKLEVSSKFQKDISDVLNKEIEILGNKDTESNCEKTIEDDTCILNDETAIIEEETCILNEETTILDEETCILNEETTILDEETTMLEEEILDENEYRVELDIVIISSDGILS